MPEQNIPYDLGGLKLKLKLITQTAILLSRF